MTSVNGGGSENQMPEYGIILPSGETLAGAVADFPKLVRERLRQTPPYEEQVLLIGELQHFYVRHAPERMNDEDWPAIMRGIADVDRAEYIAEYLSRCADGAKEWMAAWKLQELIRCVDDLEKRAALMVRLGGHMEKIRAFPEAAAAYREAISLEPVDRKIWYYAHNNLGYCLNQTGDYAGGEACCREALRINPALPNAHKNLGLALQGQERWVEAAQAFITGTLTYPADGRSLRHLLALVEANPAIHEQMPTLDDDIARCAAAVEGADR